MNGLYRSLRNENGGLRGLSGSGEPGLATLLGGTSPELDASGYTLTGGPGQTSSATRLARAHRDRRLAGVASGTGITSGGTGVGSPYAGSGRDIYDPGGGFQRPNPRPER